MHDHIQQRDRWFEQINGQVLTEGSLYSCHTLPEDSANGIWSDKSTRIKAHLASAVNIEFLLSSGDLVRKALDTAYMGHTLFYILPSPASRSKRLILISWIGLDHHSPRI